MRWVVNSTPRPLYPRERPSTHYVGGWVSPRARLDGCGKSLFPSAFDPQTFQPVANRYTDYAIQAPNCRYLHTFTLPCNTIFSEHQNTPSDVSLNYTRRAIIHKTHILLSWLLQRCAYACWNHCTNQQSSTQPQSEKVTTLTKLNSTY